MKKRIPTFLAGMLTAALIGSLGVGALAATGALTIEVNPINVQVNGETFAPKDATGASVPVFAYKGTTYAPLRALAEAYGLEVGYDAATRMATVKGDVVAPATPPTPDTALSADYSKWTAEEEKAYQEFKGMWEWEMDGYQDIKNASVFCGRDGKEGVGALKVFLSRHSAEAIDAYSVRLTQEINQQNSGTDTVFRTGPNGIGDWLWICSGQNDDWTSTYKNSVKDVDKKLSKSGM